MLLKTFAGYSIGVSAILNHNIATQFPSICPFISVSEFPRSGGNWIRDLLGDCLQLPVPRFSLLPVTFSALVHSHSHIPITKIPSVYILRDGRDVFISHFWKNINGIRSGNEYVKNKILNRHPSLLDLDKKDLDDYEKVISDFYDEWRIRPSGSKVNWGDHVIYWLSNKSDKLVIIRYEDMLNEPQETLFSAMRKLANHKLIDKKLIDFAINRNSFKAKTGRVSGQKDNAANRRSGTAGGWLNELPKSLAQQFLIDFGDALQMGKYY